MCGMRKGLANSIFQEKCSYTIAVRGLLDGGSMMVRAFAVANEMGRGGVSVATVFANSSAAPLPGMLL